MVGYGQRRDLKGWVAVSGISYATARRRDESGTLPVSAHRLGRLIMVGEPVTGTTAGTGQIVVDARVSSADQQVDLDRQVARVTEWTTGRRPGVDRVVTEVGSALNGHSRKVLALLRDPAVSTILVEHRDRFARFCAEYVSAALTAQGRRLLIVGPAEVDDELVGDVTEIVTSLCARLHGRRVAANRARRAVEAATEDAA
ncbi:IS607 family transposase [Dactylosporangium sp. CS-047395]|uniref:IS607 family transposase n=1 Tax=Dactylosporangium sp. CS-047395 TaxID=3239936 RepID=UPI003D938C95